MAMLSRRELIGTGLSAAGVGAEGEGQTSVVDPRQLAEMIDRLDGIVDQLRIANNGCAPGVCPVGDRLREAMVPFLRASNKYPDFMEVGYGVFHAMYDWHVRNQLELNVGRGPDGRYGLGYLFTRLILRPDAQPDFIGVPYDGRA
jgi:hypothetical protein